MPAVQIDVSSDSEEDVSSASARARLVFDKWVSNKDKKVRKQEKKTTEKQEVQPREDCSLTEGTSEGFVLIRVPQSHLPGSWQAGPRGPSKEFPLT